MTVIKVFSFSLIENYVIHNFGRIYEKNKVRFISCQSLDSNVDMSILLAQCVQLIFLA